MITLGDVEKAMGLFATLFAAVVYVLKRIEKKATEKEVAKQWAKGIEDKMAQIEKQLVTMESRYGQTTELLQEELHDMRVDFGQFVQQMLFKK